MAYIVRSDSQQEDLPGYKQPLRPNPSELEYLASFTSQTDLPIWPFGESVTYTPGPQAHGLYRPEVLDTISTAIDEVSAELRGVCLHIHAHPEIAFEETIAHDTLTDFMESNGFSVTRHYLGLDTAWRAAFSHKSGGRVVGVNSEMDALPGLGHACGHNLIATSGLAISIGIKAALVRHDIPGTVVLLGTPAEESAGGKLILLERGAYKEMDACVMCHPFSAPVNSMGLGTTTARQVIEVEYFGKTAHAAASPWQGQNALDAAFLAYSGLSVLRQQMEPGSMIHGTIVGKDWAPNVIPDYSKLIWMIRGRTNKQLAETRDKVKKCFEGAAMQANCKYEIHEGPPWTELRQNKALALDFARNAAQGFGVNILTAAQSYYGASTDFGNVSYALPSIHPAYSVPAERGGGNHTGAFTRSAQTEEAYLATLVCAKSLAMTGVRVLDDPNFFKSVEVTFAEERAGFSSP